MNKFIHRKRYKTITEYSHLYTVMVPRALNSLYQTGDGTIFTGKAEIDIPICGLCGNQGVIHTDATTPSGVALGKQKHYCICPNGQALRFTQVSLKDR